MHEIRAKPWGFNESDRTMVLDVEEYEKARYRRLHTLLDAMKARVPLIS